MNPPNNISNTLQDDFATQIFNHSPDKILVIGQNYKLQYFNPTAQAFSFLFGYEKLELGMTMLPTTEINYWKNILDEGFAGKILEFKKFYLRGDMKYSDLINVYAIKKENGKVSSLVFQAKKLDAQQYVPKDILENKALFRIFFETSPVGITIRKLKTQELITYNQKICDMFGCTYEQFQHYSRADYIHVEDTEAVLKNTQLLLEEKINIFKMEKQYKKQSGEIFWGLATRSSFKIGNEIYQIGILENTSTQKNIEEQLIENEAKVRTILNSTNDKIFAIDNQYKLLDFNEAAAQSLPKIFGMEKLEIGEEMLSTNPAARTHWIDHYNIVLTGKRLILEKTYTEKSELKTDIVTLSPIKNNDGETIGVAVYGKDVTDLQKTQQAFQETQIQLEDAHKIGKIGTWKYDAEFQKIIWSANTLRLFDVEHGQAMPSFTGCLQHVYQDDVPHITKAVYDAIEKKKYFDIIIRIYTAKERLIYTHTKGKPTFDKNGNLLSFEGTIQDITELKEIEENIQTTTEQYRDLFDNVNDAIVITNQKGRMIDCNHAMVKLLGYTREELGELLIKDIVHPDDQKRSKEFLQMLFDQGYYENYQGRIFHKDGSTIYILVNSTAIYDDDGNLVGSRDIVRDISELKKIEQKREQLLIELAEVNKELKDFAYIVSHDLKAPLRAIKAISHWLSEDYANQLDEAGQQQLQLLSNRVNRMHQFINGIFEYTKLGRIKESKEIVDLDKMIQEAPLMLHLDENVALNILKKLPEVYGEKVKIEQVFHNLISNAVKYNDKSVCVIEIDFEDRNTHYLFRIKDNGKGIEEKNYEKVFQIFQTLQPKDDFESTGIGLSIVKRIVQLHGGEISVKSELGKSTTFEFSLKK